jgi:hypothetical protein
LSKNFFAIAGTTLILLGILIGGYVLSREFKSISAQQTINVVTPENVEEKLKEGEILLLQNNKDRKSVV